MRKLISMLLMFAFAVLLTACGGDDAVDENAEEITQQPSGNGSQVSEPSNEDFGDDDDSSDSVSTVLVFGSDQMENLEDHLGAWRTSPTDTRDFHIFQDAGLIIEARLFTEGSSNSIRLDTYLHYFSQEDGGSLMAWAQSEVSRVHDDSAATLTATVQLPNDTALVQERMPVVVPTIDGWVLHDVPYEFFGYSDGVTSIERFTTSAGVAVPEEDGYVGIPFSEPANIVFGEEGMENRETHIEWFPPRITDTRDFHIFQDDWVILEARLSEGAEENEFNIDIYAHYFLEAFGGSLDAWANNQYSDALEIDFAVLTETIQLPASVASVTGFSDTGNTTLDGWALSEVEYYVDNYSDDFISFSSFSTTANVAVAPMDRVALSVEQADRSFSHNVLLPETSIYGVTKLFYIFNDQNAVMLVRLDNLEGNPTISASVEVYLFEEGAEIEDWVNNQYNDAVLPNPPSPIYSIVLEDIINVNQSTFKRETSVSFSLYDVAFDVSEFSNERFDLSAFSGEAEVAVLPEEYRSSPPVGPCVHYYDDRVLHIDSASSIGFKDELTEITLSNFRVNGNQFSIADVTPEYNGEEMGANVRLQGDNLICELPCSFGIDEGEWQFDAIAIGHYSTEQVVEARYATFDGGCPSTNDDGSHVSIALKPIIVTIN